MILSKKGREYVSRERLPERRHTWRQKVRIIDEEIGGTHTFYVDFGEYPDGRLAEIFITSQKTGTFVRGTLELLAQTVSLALQTGTSPLSVAAMLQQQDFSPQGKVMAEGSSVKECKSVADYIGQEISACYDETGKRKR